MLLDDNHFEKKPAFHRPFRLFLYGGILLLIIEAWVYFHYSNTALNIQLHDTFFVIALVYIPIVLSFVFFFFAGAYAHFYFVKKRPLNSGLGKIHFALTFLPILFMPLFLSGAIYGMGTSITSFIPNINSKFWIGVGLFLIGQILFLINLGVSIFKKK